MLEKISFAKILLVSLGAGFSERERETRVIGENFRISDKLDSYVTLKRVYRDRPRRASKLPMTADTVSFLIFT